MKRIGGLRRKTRGKLRKERRARGKISLSKYFSAFSVGDRVSLCVEPSVHKGFYDPKFIGKVGVISSKKGTCYEVSINDQGKDKSLIIHPVHLKIMKESQR